MPCVNRRGCADRFRDRVDNRQLLAILVNHGTCGSCANDITDNPKFGPDPGKPGLPTPYCPACFEVLSPSGGPGPFEAGQPKVLRTEGL